MSVLKSKRKESELDVYTQARKVASNILLLLCAGADGCVEEKSAFTGEKKEMYRAIEKELVKGVVSDVHKLISNILHANAIFPVSEEEVALRRAFQDKAIGDCYSLQSSLVSLLDVQSRPLSSLSFFAREIEMVETRIKKWRKYNSKILLKIKEKGRESENSVNPGNFCALNANGNANNNNANNSAGGVRPDFKSLP